MGKEPYTGGRCSDSVHDYKWVELKLKGTIPAKNKILAEDPQTGAYTRIIYFPPGFKTPEAVKHEFWEEIYILDGCMIDYGSDELYPSGSYALRQAGVMHGPFGSDRGCTILEITWYDREWYKKNKK
jgi:hypothetical protein